MLPFRVVPRSTTAPDSASNASAGLWMLLPFIPALILRFVLPLDFPVFATDETFFNQSAKMQVLEGNPLLYQFGQLFLTPGHHFLTVALYSLFGPSLSLSRTMVALFGAGVVLFVYLWGRRLGGVRIGFTAALLSAYNALLVYSSRLATLEPEVMFYMLGAAYFWFHENPRRVPLSGLFLGAALLVKAYSLLLIPVLLAGSLFALHQPRGAAPPWMKRLRPEQWISLGLGLGMTLAGYYMISILDRAQFMAIWEEHSWGRTDRRHLLHFTRAFWRHFPDLMLLSAAGVVLACKRRPAGWRFLLAWLILGLGLLSLQIYRPTRYYLQFIPLLALFAAYALQAWPPKWDWRRVFVPAVLVLMCLHQLWRFYPYYLDGRKHNGALIQTVQRVDDQMGPVEAVITTIDDAILFRHPAIPINCVWHAKSRNRLFYPREADWLPRTRFMVLKSENLQCGKSLELMDFMRSERFLPQEQRGNVLVFVRGASDTMADNRLPTQTARAVLPYNPLE